jgi:hypothetical protein
MKTLWLFRQLQGFFDAQKCVYSFSILSCDAFYVDWDTDIDFYRRNTDNMKNDYVVKVFMKNNREDKKQ